MELGKPLKCGSCDPKELALWKTNYAFESRSESSTNSFINHMTTASVDFRRSISQEAARKKRNGKPREQPRRRNFDDYGKQTSLILLTSCQEHQKSQSTTGSQEVKLSK